MIFRIFSVPKLEAPLSLDPKDDNLVLGKDYKLQCKPELNIPGIDFTYKWCKEGEPTDVTKGTFTLESFKFSDA